MRTARNHLLPPRRALTLVELLVVMAIAGALLALALPAVQHARESGRRTQCLDHLRQFGLALHLFHGTHGYLPPGVVAEAGIHDALHTGFTYLLPYLEQGNVHALYDFSQPWYEPANHQAVSRELPLFYCPSNRCAGSIDLRPHIQQWGYAMPPSVGATDYALCKGANAGLATDPEKIPAQARGLFNGTMAESAGGLREVPRFRVSLDNVRDGLSNTFAIGEAAGGSSRYLVADVNNPAQPAIGPFAGRPTAMDQAWGAASMGTTHHPWYAGVFAVTAQFGLPPNPRDEPMNRRPGMPTIIGSDPSGYNLYGRDRVSGFRSLHRAGCHFLFADGAARMIHADIAAETYRGLSTYSGSEIAERSGP